MTGKVAIITGGSQGIGAGLVAGYRARGWAVVATASTITPSQDPGVLTVAGDIADPATAGQIVGAALERFGRLDTLVNNVGVFISKPFTGYTAADYARVVGVRAHLPPAARSQRLRLRIVVTRRPARALATRRHRRRDGCCCRGVPGQQVDAAGRRCHPHARPERSHAGDALTVPAGAVHAVRNADSGDAAGLTTYVVEKGKPLLTLVE